MAMAKIKWVALALVIAAGCSKSGGDIDTFMKMDTEKAAAFDVGGKDCVAKAKSVGDWRRANSSDYQALRKKINDGWKGGVPDDVKEKYGEQMQKNKKSVMTAMMDCSNDETFGKMMDETKDKD
jgi:hypothetical protein